MDTDNTKIFQEIIDDLGREKLQENILYIWVVRKID